VGGWWSWAGAPRWCERLGAAPGGSAETGGSAFRAPVSASNQAAVTVQVNLGGHENGMGLVSQSRE
jgi:hypothetical protein